MKRNQPGGRAPHPAGAEYARIDRPNAPNHFHSREYWQSLVDRTFKKGVSPARRAEGAKELVRLIAEDTTMNFALMAGLVFDFQTLSTKDIAFLLDHKIVEALLTRLEPWKINDRNRGNDIAAAFALNIIWRLTQWPADVDELDFSLWRDPRVRAHIERFYNVPNFFSRILGALDADLHHTRRGAVWIACYIIKVIRLGDKKAIWTDVMPLIATALKKYDAQLLRDELDDNPLTALLYRRHVEPGELTPDMIDIDNTVSVAESFISLAVSLYAPIINDDHELLYAALTPELIDCIRFYARSPNFGVRDMDTMRVADSLLLLANLLVHPRKICEAKHQLYTRRMDRVLSLWPTMVDDIASLCDKMFRVDYIKLLLANNVAHTQYIAQSHGIAECVIEILWTLSGMDSRYAEKLKPHIKIIVKMHDVNQEILRNGYPKQVAQALIEMFDGGRHREFDADFGARQWIAGRTITATIRPQQSAMLIAIVGRLTLQYQECMEALGPASIDMFPAYVMHALGEAGEVKECGNKMYAEKDYWGASVCYRTAAELARIGLAFYRRIQVPYVEHTVELVCICHSNRAQCYIELKEYRAAIREAKAALQQLPNHAKSKARLEKAERELAAGAAAGPTERLIVPHGTQISESLSAELKELGIQLIVLPQEESLSGREALKRMGIELPGAGAVPLAAVAEHEAPVSPRFVLPKKRRRRWRKAKRHATASSAAAAAAVAGQEQPTSSSASAALASIAVEAAQALEEDAAEEEEELLECFVCFEAQEKPLGMHPCGHGPLCAECYSNLHIQKCPICRAAIKSLVANPKSGFKFFFTK